MRLTCLLAAIALAGSGPATAAAFQGQGQSAKSPPAKKVCQTYTVTGSRLATKRVCGTADEWADRRLQDRQAIEKVQMQPCVLQGTGGTGRPSC